MELFRQRGTVEGIKRYVEIYTGVRPEVLESFLQRPVDPSFLGRPGSVLGCSFHLSTCRPETPPREDLYRDYAHRFTALIYLQDRCDEEVVGAVVNRIVETNRPAHTEHTVCFVYPEARLEQQSSVGLDFVLGEIEEPRTQIGGCPDPVGSSSAHGWLGVDTVLSERRPDYLRRHELRI